MPRSIVNTSGTILLDAATSRSGRSTFRDRLLECDHSSDDFTYDLHAGRLAANERRDRTFAPNPDHQLPETAPPPENYHRGRLPAIEVMGQGFSVRIRVVVSIDG